MNRLTIIQESLEALEKNRTELRMAMQRCTLMIDLLRIEQDRMLTGGHCGEEITS